MDTKDLKGLMEAYSEVYAPQQIDEISQKTATRAYAASKTGEFEGADSDRDIRRTDNLEKHIKRKFGDKAVKHAERAADAQTFGRKDASGRSKQRPQPRIQKSDYRTTQDGKMHKQDQRELKTNLRIKRDRRLRAEDFDIFDVVLEFLQAEGYAETLEEAEWLMANVIDEEAIDIILGEEKLPLDQQRRSKIGRQIGKRIDSAGKDLAGSGAPFMPKSIRNNLRQSATKKAGEVNKMVGALKSAQKYAKEEYVSQYVEDYDLYDIILSHLLDEGYAETLEAAEAIMVNMSEEWRDDIMEISDRKVKAVRNAREKQWNKQFGKNRAQDPTDDMTDKIDKLIDQRNKRTGSNVKKTTMGQLGDKLRDRGRW